MSKITCYSNILENLSILKDTGIFPNERIEEIVQYLAPENFGPAKLENGRIIPEWFCHLKSGHIWNDWTFKNSKYLIYNNLLEKFLTESEINALNKRANELWRVKNDAQKFEKATKVNAADWKGPVYYGDTYWNSVEDFNDWAADRDEGEDKPEFIWAVDEIRPIIDFDAESILERKTEEAHEDFSIFDLNGLDEFKAAVNKFVEANKSEVNWYSSGKIAVLLN